MEREQEQQRTRVRRGADLGQAVRERRRLLGISQDELAQHLGFSRSYLSELEHGVETVQVRRLLQVLTMLGLDVEVVPRAGDGR